MFGLAHGILMAASSDNVQPLAILACQAFGATIAMSQETCLRIEMSVIKKPKPAVIKFLQVTVGYAANDCCQHFGQTKAGVQFLALAVMLTSIMDPFEGSWVLDLLLSRSAQDKTLLPRRLQRKIFWLNLNLDAMLLGLRTSLLATSFSYTRIWDLKMTLLTTSIRQRRALQSLSTRFANYVGSETIRWQASRSE
ncbi:hypothetical protein B0H63DRAFT_449894 [Podospora didyma]|uniref:Uncharacterized protein n=1 Tax=Podospora didyma TaxID=330526 RepID=A0AAE0U030_9PEZI|nr:hypothetical protein B0H63DRAFT_449894 [Podospora didyma]